MVSVSLVMGFLLRVSLHSGWLDSCSRGPVTWAEFCSPAPTLSKVHQLLASNTLGFLLFELCKVNDMGEGRRCFCFHQLQVTFYLWCLSFLIYKMGMIRIPIAEGSCDE